MTDYFATVARGVPMSPERYALSIGDDGICVVTPPHSSRVLTYELVFPTLLERDVFMQSRRTRRDVAQLHGALTLIMPNDILAHRKPELSTEQGDITQPDIFCVSKLLGVSVEVLRTSQRKAWNAIIAWYQERRV